MLPLQAAHVRRATHVDDENHHHDENDRFGGAFAGARGLERQERTAPETGTERMPTLSLPQQR